MFVIKDSYNPKSILSPYKSGLASEATAFQRISPEALSYGALTIAILNSGTMSDFFTHLSPTFLYALDTVAQAFFAAISSESPLSLEEL